VRRKVKTKIIVTTIALGLALELTSCWSQRLNYTSTFEIVWKKINETYFDSTFGGLNWKDVHDRYLPQITAAEKDQEFYRLVNKMLWELKVSHANLVPPGFLASREPLVCAEGSPGMDMRVLNGVAVITSVKPGSPAEKAGLRPGHVIEAIDGIPVEQIVQEAGLVTRPPDNSRNRIAIVTKAILGRIYGPAATEVSIAYSNEQGEKSEKKLLRTKRSGRAVGPSSMLYLAVDLESRRLDNGIGYVRLNTFQPPLVAQVSNAIKSLGNVAGVIFDVRGNAGGEIEGMPDLFLKERALLFLRRLRGSETKIFVDPADDAFKGPLVLLIDGLTGSAGELFAGCLQAIGRAVVVGEHSPGAATESDMTPLPNGAIFMYPVAQLATPDGTVLEGHGVVPNIEVGLDREMLLKGIDSQLEAAREYLEKILRE
jgi:carboxyl-terminal processing protease